jgi:hypothetical protein
MSTLESLAKMVAHNGKILSARWVEEEKEWLFALHRLSDCALLVGQRTPEPMYLAANM